MKEFFKRLDAPTVGGWLVAVFLMATFLFASFAVITTANDPPLLADPAPTATPALLCPSVVPTPSQEPSTSSSSTESIDDQATTNSSSATGSGPAGGAASTPSPSSAPSSPTVDAGAQVTCAADEVVLAPQYRGGYDPNARLMALLAVVLPLLTTIVAFYFGQRAGAGAGEAEKQKVVAQVMATDPAGTNTELSDLKEQLRKANKL